MPAKPLNGAHPPALNGAHSTNGAYVPTEGARIPITIVRPDQTAGHTAPEPSIPRQPEETVQQRIDRERPRSIRMQLRFLHTLVFAFSLFGRLIFWQIYVARWFPGWVERNNIPRWVGYAREFRKFALFMGGVMIKLGQFASTRADTLPEEVIRELESLQDEVPTIDYHFIREVIETELGPTHERFEWINEEPVAAASLGQVHRAKLLNGDRVVVKVQRPGIRSIVYTDLAALMIVARVAMRFSFIRRRADMVQLAEEFGRVLLEEVSYSTETDNARRFADMFRDDMGVYVPDVYQQHSTDKVIVMEDVTTIKIGDFAAMEAAGIDRRDVAQRLMDTYMVQIFDAQFFHADPHPGNLFVYPLPVEDESRYIGRGGRPFYLIFVDFGMTGHLTSEIRQGLIDTLKAVIQRDPHQLVQAYIQLGFILPGADAARIEEAARRVFDQVWGLSMKEISSIDFDVIMEMGQEFNDLLFDMPFRIPQDFVYLGRTVGILSGMCTTLDPDFNPWTQIQYYMQRYITSDDNGTLQSLAEPLTQMFSRGPLGFLEGVQQIASTVSGTRDTRMLLERVVNGDVAVVSKANPQLQRQLNRIEAQNKRTTRVFLAGSLMITASIFYINGDAQIAYAAYGLSGLFFLLTLTVRS